MEEFKLKIIEWLVRKWDILVVARYGDTQGYVMMNADEEGEKHLREILHSSFVERQPQVKDLILGAAEDWLKEREIETKEFIERIK